MTEPQPDLEWMEEPEDEWEAQDEWDFLTEALTELMQKIAKRYSNFGYWKASVRNFGWRSLDGEASFRAEDGTKLLQKILPDTPCHFRIFRDGNELRIQNFHHDSPMGKEWYTVRPMYAHEVEEYEGW